MNIVVVRSLATTLEHTKLIYGHKRVSSPPLTRTWTFPSCALSNLVSYELTEVGQLA